MELRPEFVEHLHRIMPRDAQALAQALTATEPAVSVRLNPFKGAELEPGLDPVPWCRYGAYLEHRPPFTFDPDWHAGRYYVQDAASMFLHHVLQCQVQEPVRYLDLCAAPGGKATCACGALPAGSLVVANEVVLARARVLAHNMARWGQAATVVTCDTPERVGRTLPAFFDVIAADVPCSGEGMMRKDDEAVEQWSPQLVRQCAERQRDILAQVWPALKPGGLLIYSTCTFNREENELMADYIARHLGAEAIEVPVLPAWRVAPGIDTIHRCYRFMPHRTRGEGLFVCAMRKDAAPAAAQKSQKPRRAATPPVPAAVKGWVRGDYVWQLAGDTVTAIPAAHHGAVAAVQQALHVMAAGVEVAHVKGKSLVPTHALAMSTALRGDAFPAVDVDYATAVAFLRGESIQVTAPRGHTLVTHQGAVLGWVNNLGARANNLYPKPLRILSSHAPTTPPVVVIPRER